MTKEEIQKEEKIRDREGKVLKEIYSKIPKNLRDNVIKKKKKNAELIRTLELAIASPNILEGKKEKYRVMLNDPQVQMDVFVEDKGIAKMIDLAIERGIKKAIKEKRLRPRNDKQLRAYEEYRNEEARKKDSTGETDGTAKAKS